MSQGWVDNYGHHIGDYCTPVLTKGVVQRVVEVRSCGFPDWLEIHMT